MLGAMKPMTPTAGFTARVVVADGDPHAADLRRVLNAGSSIGAVRHCDDHDHIYEVRSELFEYLSIVAKREYEKDKSRMDLAELERTVSVALLPEVGANAEMVLSHMHPIVERHGFMAEIKLAEVAEPADLRTLRNALNAGSVYERVQRAGTDASHFYIHTDFFKSLTALRGRLMLSAGDSGARPIQLEAQDTASEAAKSIIHERPALPQDTTRSDRSPERAEADEPPPTRALRAPRDRAHFLNGFLAVLGIQPAHFTDLSGEAFSAALAAAGSFAELRQRHPSLNRYLEIRERDKREIFEQANQDFEQSIADRNSSEWTELDFAYQDLSQNWQVVVLLPGGPFEDLMDRIVQELETDRAADTLSPEDAALLTVAQNVLGLLQDSFRQSTADWSNLGGAFQNIENGSDNIRPFPNVASN